MINKLILLVLILLASTKLSSAQSDTIYVYDDVIVYDTVVVYDTVYVDPKPDFISIVKMDTTNGLANLLMISKNKTATIPVDRIILIENIKNSESMKKLTFLGVVFFAFKSIVIAQNSYDISLNNGAWWFTGKMEHSNRPTTPISSIGFHSSRAFGESSFGRRLGLELSALIPSQDFKYDGTPGVWHSDNGEEYSHLNNLYGGPTTVMISVPFQVYYHKYKFQPYLGLNYNMWLLGEDEFGHKQAAQNVALDFGFQYEFGKRMSVGLNLKQNILPDVDVTSVSDVVNNTNQSFKLRNSQAMISFRIKLDKIEK